METLLKSEFAKRLHVSKARVSQMIQKGMPVTAEG
jgi:plasmid maintenance system antidote protein VapI